MARGVGDRSRWASGAASVGAAAVRRCGGGGAPVVTLARGVGNRLRRARRRRGRRRGSVKSKAPKRAAPMQSRQGPLLTFPSLCTSSNIGMAPAHHHRSHKTNSFRICEALHHTARSVCKLRTSLLSVASCRCCFRPGLEGGWPNVLIPSQVSSYTSGTICCCNGAAAVAWSLLAKATTGRPCMSAHFASFLKARYQGCPHCSLSAHPPRRPFRRSRQNT